MGSITHGTKPKKQPNQGRSKAVRVLAILLALLLLVPLVMQIVQVSSYAVTQQDIDSLSSQQAQLEEQKGKLQTQLDKLSKQENSAADRCSVLNDQIDLLNQQVDNTRAMVDDYTKQIKASQKELKAAKAEEEKYYDLFCQRVRNMEENGSTSYWQILFGASDFSDLLDRASVMEYDNDVLDGLEQARQKVDATTQALQEKKSSKEKALSKLEAQQQEINTTAKEAEAALKEVRDNRKTYSAQLSQMNAQTEDLAQEIVTAKSAYAAEQKAAAEEAKRQQKAAEAEQKRQEEAARREQEAQQKPSKTDQNKNNNNNKNDQQKPSKEEPKKEPTKEPEKQPEQKPEETKPSKPSVSGAAVANYAMKFIGGKYVWGGANLATGVDCSGFVMCVYQHFGYSLPHYSESLAGCGRGVSYANAQPGDIICYRGHCGIYIGGGMMVNALGAKYGIVVNQVNTSRLAAVRRIV